jgi:Raf kinase inhibitor-like YbhB/YbcL family protein
MRIIIIAFFVLFGKKEFKIKSVDFADGNHIQTKFTCDGQNLSPALVFENPPKKTVSFAMIMDDTESPNGEFVHWVLFNIPAETLKIEENSSAGTLAKNTLGQNKYFGPCPPNGVHTYNFKLYAVDILLPLTKDAGKKELLDALKGHILGECVLKGTYQRS